MINTDMRDYDYYLYGDKDEYGQATLISDDSGTPIVQGQIRMAINVATQGIKDSVAYSGTNYTGLTHDLVSDKMVIQFGVENLKVLYVNPMGRYKVVYLGVM